MKVWLATTKEFNGVVDNFREEQNRFHIKEERESGTVMIADATTGKTIFMGLQKDPRTWLVRYDPTYFGGKPSSATNGQYDRSKEAWANTTDEDRKSVLKRLGLSVNYYNLAWDYMPPFLKEALHIEFSRQLESPKSGHETEMVIKITDPDDPENFTIFYDLTDRKREHLRRSYTKRGWIIEEFERPISERKSSGLNSVSISWDPEFDQESIEIISPFIPKAQEEIQRRAGRPLDFPPKVFAMTRGEIVAGRLVGAGHGMFIRPSTIKVNPSLPPMRLLANYIHENLHWALPSKSEHQLDILTDEILQSIGAPGLNSASNDGQLTIEGVLERYG